MSGRASAAREKIDLVRSTPAAETALDLYRAMVRIRRIEEAIAERYGRNEMRCPVHLSVGQEATAVGACAALRRDDRIVSTHRCHGHYLAKGGDLPAMLAELHGKETGCCGGRGGSMHLFDQEAGVVASVPVVGSSVPLGVGIALRFQQRGEDLVCMAFLGDAALEEGAFHEAANFAAVHRLPVVFFIENNLYSVYTRLDERQPPRALGRLVEAHGLASWAVDGNDVLAVFKAAEAAVSRARSGQGPTAVVADTYRWREHCGPSYDDDLGYRPRGELASWQERCPVARFRQILLQSDILGEAGERQMLGAIDAEIADAFAAVEAAPFPDPATVGEGVWRGGRASGHPILHPVAHDEPSREESVGASREITAAQAICEATTQALEADSAVFVMGEGATDPKGIFGTTAGLLERFGPRRIMEMPVAENGFTGVAIGAALMGQRPIVVHQRVEFSLLALEQLANNAAKMHYVSAGAHAVPMVVRLVVGRGWGQGPAHSQSLEALWSYLPGLKVVMPATAHDCKGLLLGAIQDENPVIFIEHRWVHYAKGNVPIEARALPLDGPKRLRQGDAVTVVATSYMTLEALQAAEALAGEGCAVDLWDLRVLSPLSLDGVIESVERTGRLITVDTGFVSFGIGAEIGARVVQAAFAKLKAPPVRLGLASHPTPSSRSLAGAYYPRSLQIAEAAARLVGLPDRQVTRLVGELRSERDRLPLDIPHPAFKGPF